MASADDVPVKGMVSFCDLGGAPFLLLIFSYFADGMLFWGVSLFIPMVVSLLGFSGLWQGLASSLPYFLAILFAIPMSYVSDKTQRRGLIAAGGLLVAGILLITLPLIASPVVKMAVITLSIAWFTSCFTTNIWSIITSSVRKGSGGGCVRDHQRYRRGRRRNNGGLCRRVSPRQHRLLFAGLRGHRHRRYCRWAQRVYLFAASKARDEV